MRNYWIPACAGMTKACIFDCLRMYHVWWTRKKSPKLVISSEARNLCSVTHWKYKISPCGRNDILAESDFLRIHHVWRLRKKSIFHHRAQSPPKDAGGVNSYLCALCVLRGKFVFFTKPSYLLESPKFSWTSQVKSPPGPPFEKKGGFVAWYFQQVMRTYYCQDIY